MIRGATLNERFDSDIYAHLDITVADLLGNEATPWIRFKLFVGGDGCGLEFRRLDDWPEVFEVWPGADRDLHGDLYKLSSDAAVDDALFSVRERRMLGDLATALPTIIKTVAEQVPQIDRFAEAAETVAKFLGLPLPAPAAPQPAARVVSVVKPTTNLMVPVHSSNEALPKYVRTVLAEFETVELVTLKVCQRPLPDRLSPIVICVIKNESDRLHDFFRHYREAGIERFCFIDNGSSDGTLDYLLAQPDTDVFQRLGKFDWMLKQGWINRAVAHYGLDRWFMYLDADEHIVFDGIGDHSFQDLTRLMEADGIHRIRGFLVDMYADGPLLDSTYVPGALLRQAYPFFDTDTYVEERYKEVISVKGGPRTRIFGVNQKKFRPEMTKYPLFRAMPDEYMVNPHHLWPYVHNFNSPRVLAIMHFKFLPGIIDKIKLAIEAENYWDGSLEYKCYLETISEDPVVGMMGPTTGRFNGPEDFVALGLIASLPWSSSLALLRKMGHAFRLRRAVLDDTRSHLMVSSQ